MTVTKDVDDPFITIQIDRSLIKETDAGTFNLDIEISDPTESSEYSIPITIGYKFVKKPVEDKAAETSSTKSS